MVLLVLQSGVKATKRIFFLTACVIALAAIALLCYDAASEKTVRSERETFAMGTLVRVAAYGRDQKKLDTAVAEAVAEISRLEEFFSVNIAGSEISRVNADPARPGGHVISRETYELLTLALGEAEELGGVFDPTVGGLVRIWGIGTENARVPASGEIQQLLKRVGWEKVKLWQTGGQGQAVYRVSAGEGQALDLGGIAKGYAADCAARVLDAHGVQSGLIDIGGNLAAMGKSPKGREWRLGLQDPFGPRGDYFASISVADATVVTSGPYERFFIEEGVRYHHILDPETGYPVSSDLESVSIVMRLPGSGEASARSDALSTALFVMGFDKAVRFLENHGEVQAVLVSGQKGEASVYVTEGLTDMLSPVANGFIRKHKMGAVKK